ncbi:hypothetical protein G6045_16295 [Streptomyces sp. YC504]|uniref:Uncharacterized protein n=1 Tax=Streptomyces mesophilus TaxID=1775132 RepID=A0A6G4XIH0_9ACTN|nr:hypothetical protein [Streptomyces mesophilus]NGO77208.1 hypothetical protein [Streptomyces mesophilus]
MTSDTVTLPWKKSERVELEGAYLTQGMLVSVQAGHSQTADGKLAEAPSCSITVDGKTVVTKPVGTIGACECKVK